MAVICERSGGGGGSGKFNVKNLQSFAELVDLGISTPMPYSTHSATWAGDDLYCIPIANANSYIYNKITKTATPFTVSLSVARIRVSVCHYAGKLYFAGAVNNTSSHRVVDIYDIASKNWTTGALMSAYRYDFDFLEHNGLLYAVGGYEYSSGDWIFSNRIDVYNPATNTWSYIYGSYPTGNTSGVRSIIVEGRIISFIPQYGGGVSSPATSIAIYDIASNTVSTIASTVYMSAYSRGLAAYKGLAFSVALGVSSSYGIWGVNPNTTSYLKKLYQPTFSGTPISAYVDGDTFCLVYYLNSAIREASFDLRDFTIDGSVKFLFDKEISVGNTIVPANTEFTTSEVLVLRDPNTSGWIEVNGELTQLI